MSTIFNDPNYYNSLTSSTATNALTNILGPFTTSSGSGYDYLTSNTTTATTTGNIEVKFKKCRECCHAHIEGQSGCIDNVGYMVAFVNCNCKEYVPSDNLEYLEWKYNKKQKDIK